MWSFSWSGANFDLIKENVLWNNFKQRQEISDARKRKVNAARIYEPKGKKKETKEPIKKKTQ